jgi:hypothetical protein
MYTFQGKYTSNQVLVNLTGSILTVVTLILFICVMFIPAKRMTKLDVDYLINRFAHTHDIKK